MVNSYMDASDVRRVAVLAQTMWPHGGGNGDQCGGAGGGLGHLVQHVWCFHVLLVQFQPKSGTVYSVEVNTRQPHGSDHFLKAIISNLVKSV